MMILLNIWKMGDCNIRKKLNENHFKSNVSVMNITKKILLTYKKFQFSVTSKLTFCYNFGIMKNISKPEYNYSFKES